MYTALYRSERPEVFSEILGQEHIVRILKNQIATGTVSHAYLFCGTRGTGKTTTARILAKAVNCVDQVAGPCGECESCKAIKEGRFIDVIEIDAASNNGVENIREINENVKYPPAVGRKKVYIIDEVHMLSAGAFNALLKTLEEPPENVIFILATTEPQKLPQTILSRCMRLDFKHVPEKTIMEGMSRICTQRGIAISEDGLKLLAANADGSVRDGLSILDQCISTGEKNIDRKLILEFLGTVGDEFFIELTDKVSLGDISSALLLLNDIIAEGKDVKQLMKDWNSHYRNLLITKYVKDPASMLNMSSENLTRLKEQSEQITLEEIDKAIVILSRTINEARWSTQPRILLEMAMVEIATGQFDHLQQAVQMPRRQPSKTMKSAPKETSQIVKKDSQQADEGKGNAASVEPEPQAKSDKDNGLAEDEAQTHDESGDKNRLNEKELEDIWYKVFEMGENIKGGSFNAIKNQAHLVAIDGKKFTVEASSPFTEAYLNMNRNLIEELMEEVAGANRMNILTTNSAEPARPMTDEEDMAQKAKDLFGLDVTIK